MGKKEFLIHFILDQMEIDFEEEIELIYLLYPMPFQQPEMIASKIRLFNRTEIYTLH